MVPADSRRIPRAPRYSGYHWASDGFGYGAVTLCDVTFQSLLLTVFLAVAWSYNPREAGTSRVWALPRSLATTYGITFVFSSCGYLDVSVPHVSLLHTMDSCTGDRAFLSAGFPHSEICASSAICAFTQLIAACHVLLRLLVPGHSPYALSSLTFSDSPVLSFQNFRFS